MNEIQDRDKIKPYNATKYLRQMKYLPDITPLCGILLILLMIFIIHPTDGGGIWVGNIPEAKYAHYEPSAFEGVPTIGIKKNGEVHFNFDYKSVELNRLPVMIADYLEEMQSKDSKVLFTVASDTPWSKVRDVMDALKNSKTKVVGFVTESSATILDYFCIQNMYREKGLRLPESAK
jgi:biopolymer transport protein ExbD